jgi:hypothetical protein
MRPVDKGERNEEYKPYGKALIPLATQIGWFCSYCEMPIHSHSELEHVVSISRGGDEFKWHNFPLACKYCNGPGNKWDKVYSREGYFWPDTDNTFLAFEYDEANHIRPSGGLTQEHQQMASATILLLGLDRFPGSDNPPTPSDKRYITRIKTWAVAIESLSNWHNKPSSEMARQIVLTAIGHGFFSIWMTVFQNIPRIKRALIDAFPGTAKNCFDQKNGNPVARPGGKI